MAVAAATPPGTVISNAATIEFTHNGAGNLDIATTNTVSATVVPQPSTSTASILRFSDAASATQTSTAGPTQCLSGGAYVALSAPNFSNGTSVDAAQVLALSQTQWVHDGDAAFVQVSDADQNRDASQIDTVDVVISSSGGDQETLRLRETGVNTGVFVGYVQTREANAVRGDCLLQAQRNSTLTLTYTDRFNNTDVSSVTALIDPYGVVFDSMTGTPVDGAVVKLVNANTGAPAMVFGDDGSSTYPALMTTGNAVTDSGGTTYQLPPGMFRFPLVAPGEYRFEVTPPTGYTFASGRSMSQLSALGTTRRLSTASFGTTFNVQTTGVVAVDLPVDPSGTQLFLSKSTTTTVASQGDFVQYTLSVQNTSSTGAVTNVVVTDTLPTGLRYQAGSARLGAQRLADPTIGGAGRTLNFNIGSLAAAATVNLTYVVEVTVAAHDEQLTNRARASNAAGAASNTAQATIRLRNELFTDQSFIVGRVVAGECNQDRTSLEGVAGVRVYLEDGRYAVTDDEGKYHFEAVAPGSHVVQMDTITVPDALEPQVCADNVRNAGRGYSQFVDLRAGAMWRADFVLKRKPPPQGALRFDMQSSVIDGMQLQHAIQLQTETLGIDNARVIVTLPEGLDYVAGSAKFDADTIADPQNLDGTLIFRLGGMAANATSRLTFNTRVLDHAGGGLVLKSALVFDTPVQKNQRGATVENHFARGDMSYESASYRFAPHFDVLGTTLSDADRVQLDKLADEWRDVKNLRLRAVGHTDSRAIPKAMQTRFADNYALSKARAQAVTDYLRTRLKLLDDGHIEVDGKGADEPLAAGHDEASLAHNRRVEIDIEGLRVKQLGEVSVIQARASAPAITTQGVNITPLPRGTTTVSSVSMATVQHDERSAPRGARSNEAATARGYAAPDIDVETLQGEPAILRPAAAEVPAIPSVKIAIQHAPDQTIELRLNDALVSALNFDGTVNNNDQSLALSRWRGVNLKDGDNDIVAIVRSGSGHEVTRLTRRIHYSGGAVRAELINEQSVLSADGNTRPVITLRLFDAAGEPARPGTVGAFSIDAPYRSWLEAQALQDKQLQALAPRDPQFVVGDEGMARIELEPTSQSGMVVMHLRFSERQTQDMRAWLAPQARDWVLVGLAEGSAGYNFISEHAEAASADDLREAYSDDGRIAFFAKGRIKGDYLLTLAYDSQRTAQDKQSLLGSIDPHRYYTLYGDGSEQRFEAPSSKKLYIKLERRQFMAMFGDFTTGLTVTELSRYSRTLTGVKSEYAGERFGYNAFAANTDQGYVQDELQGDGTSGLYRLSQQNIIANSDQLRIEVRDRIRTEVVIETRTLTRYLDYDIDYLNGTLYFKQPIMSRDQNFNPQFIIVDYEVESDMKQALTAGGRGYVKLGKRTEVGATFVNEGVATGDTRLGGLDTQVKLTDSTRLRAEVARTDSDNPARVAQSNAWFTELKHVSKRIDASAYVRVQENGFGFGQQLSTETGSRKAGADVRVKLDEQWSLKTQVLEQELEATHAERQLAAAEVNRTTQLTSAGIGTRYVGENNISIGDVSTSQAFVNGSIKLFDQRLTLRGAQDMSLNGSSAVTDFPERSLVGIDYLLNATTTVFADYEHANGANFDADMTRVGLRASPWQRAQMTSSMNQQFTENGARTFANLGLTQGWQVNQRWAMDFGIDQSKTVRGENAYSFNQNAPPASGTVSTGTTTQWQTGDYLAWSVASAYRAELWSVNERIEHRHGDAEDRWSFISGFYREAVRGHAFALVTQYMNSSASTSGDTVAAAVQLSWAYRPVDSRFIVLDRIDLKHQRNALSSQGVQSSRLVNNTHVNWQVNNRTQVGMQFGLRYVVSDFSGDVYRGASGLLGLDYRRDLTSIFDVGVHGAALQSFQSGVSNVTTGGDVGVTFMKNAWVSIGYNVRGSNDKDFDDAHYLAQGPYLKFRIKFDQDTFKDLDLAALRGKTGS